jgi:hypothetical protein
VSSGDPNPYYTPEKFGLKVLGEIDWNDEPYQFDMTTVWVKEGTAQFYWADDAGCSCPIPFEFVESMDDLKSGQFMDLYDHLGGMVRHYEGDESNHAATVRGAVGEVLMKASLEMSKYASAKYKSENNSSGTSSPD